MSSYFSKEKNKLKGIYIASTKKHLDYVPSYDGKTYRRHNTTTTHAAVDGDGDGNIDADATNEYGEKNNKVSLRREHYVDEINTWLNSYTRELNKPMDSVQNKDICRTFYNELVELIYKEGFQIRDEYQFKEDVIHYLYSLADLDSI